MLSFVPKCPRRADATPKFLGLLATICLGVLIGTSPWKFMHTQTALYLSTSSQPTTTVPATVASNPFRRWPLPLRFAEAPATEPSDVPSSITMWSKQPFLNTWIYSQFFTIKYLRWLLFALVGTAMWLATKRAMAKLVTRKLTWAIAAASDSYLSPPGYFYLDDIEYQVIAKAEIPAMIPRQDLLTQVKNWARWHFEANGYEMYGLKMPVTSEDDEDGKALSFTVKIPTMSPQYPVVELEVGMDDSAVVLKQATKETGWGIQKTFNMHIDDSLEIYATLGRFFVIRVRKSPVPVPYDAKPAISYVMQGLMHAVDRYYTFGSPFKYDAT